MLTRVRGARVPDGVHGARGDDGITLIELIVAMTLTTILGAIALSFFVTAETDTVKSQSTNQLVADARNALEGWTSLVRVAGWLDRSAKTDRFEEITPTKLVFYANLNNLATADQTTAAATKVALLLRVTDASRGEGELVQIIFGPDNTTPASVRRVALDVTPTGGPGVAIFQPYNAVGGAIDPANTLGCASGRTPVEGLCLQSPPVGSGLLDPQAVGSSLRVSGGTLRGNAALNVDKTLAAIGGVNIAFSVADDARSVSVDFTGSASVNSGFAS